MIAQHWPRGLRVTLVGLTVTFIGISRQAAADPIFGVSLHSYGIEIRDSSAVSLHGEEHSGFEGTNFYGTELSGAASPGSVSVIAESHIQLTPAVTLGIGSILNQADVSAGFRLDDVIVSGPSPSVETSLRLSFHGEFVAAAFAQLGGGVGNEADASSLITVVVTVNGTQFVGSAHQARVWNVDTQSGDGSSSAFDLLAGFTGGQATLITPLVSVPVGTPFVVGLSMSAFAETRSSHTILGSRRQADAELQFGSTLSFPVSGSVFDLPAGFTVNSVSGLITDNDWQQPASAVPEPATMLLVAFGSMVVCRRRRRHLLGHGRHLSS